VSDGVGLAERLPGLVVADVENRPGDVVVWVESTAKIGLFCCIRGSPEQGER